MLISLLVQLYNVGGQIGLTLEVVSRVIQLLHMCDSAELIIPQYYFSHNLVPANTKHLYNICTMLVQRRRRWAGVLQMLYKLFIIY